MSESLKNYCIDTHPFIWYVSNSHRLSKNAASALESVELGESVLYIPIIVLAELVFITEKKKIELSFDECIQTIKSSSNVRISRLTERHIRELRKERRISEMHDRLIVVDAKIRKATLITKDSEIWNSAAVPIVW